MKGKNTGFILLAMLAAILVAGIAYMFLFKPMLDTRQEAMEETESVHSFNATLNLRLAEYQRDWALMPQFEEEIAQIGTQLVPQEDLPGLRERLAATFDKYELVANIDNVSPATLVAPGTLSLAIPAAVVGRESYIEGLEFANLYQTSLRVEVLGTQTQILLAAGDLQLQEGRLLVVQSLEMTAQPTEERPDLYRGSFVVIVFTLVDPANGLDPGGLVAAP